MRRTPAPAAVRPAPRQDRHPHILVAVSVFDDQYSLPVAPELVASQAAALKEDAAGSLRPVLEAMNALGLLAACYQVAPSEAAAAFDWSDPHPDAVHADRLGAAREQVRGLVSVPVCVNALIVLGKQTAIALIGDTATGTVRPADGRSPELR